jgi:hypothetical protein
MESISTAHGPNLKPQLQNKKRFIKSDAVKELERIAFEKLKEKYPSFPFPIKAKYTDQTSNGLTKCVIDYIEFRGFQAERINSTGRQLDGRKSSTDILGSVRTIGSVKWIKGSGTVGTSDISATIQGRSVIIEVKCLQTNDRYQSKGQIDYQKQIEAAGGFYLIVRTFQDFYDWFNRKKARP